MKRGYVETGGVLRAGVELLVSGNDMKDWPTEDIEAFFRAIAEAKRIVERNNELRDKHISEEATTA